jgi:hypothetical protein
VSDYGFGLLVILFFFGLAGGIVGRMKGSSFVVWFLISFCMPFIGLLTALFYRYENRVLKLYDAVCMRCGAELEFPDVAIAPQARSAALRSE